MSVPTVLTGVFVLSFWVLVTVAIMRGVEDND